MEQKCSTCGEVKEMSEFYKRAFRKSGYRGTCIECCKEMSRRSNATPEHRKRKAEYCKSEAGKMCSKKSYAEYKRNHPDRYNAHQRLNYAVQTGKIEKQPCEVCSETDNVQGHHDDYSKPLDVRWLCKKHHIEHHSKVKEGL